uniref:Uncharacterized protein n=1 Tax=Oryza brachyantha TaxID=4533 RepID=J3N7U8_ORYBR
MENYKSPSSDLQENSRKHERSTKSSTTMWNTQDSFRSRNEEPQIWPTLSTTCPSGLIISDMSPKGENLLEGQGISADISSDTGKGLLEPAPYWSVNSSYHSIPVSALPPKRRCLRELLLNQASDSEVRPPVVPVASPAQVPLIGSNNGASLGRKSYYQDRSLGPINWRSARWWNNYRNRSLDDDADTAEKKNSVNSQKVGDTTARKSNRVEWGYGLAKYEREKNQGSNNLHIDGDDADGGINNKSMAATMDCAATTTASSLGSNVPPASTLTNPIEGVKESVQQKEKQSSKFSLDNSFLRNSPSSELGITSIQLEKQKEKENLDEVSIVDCVASEVCVGEKDYEATDVVAQMFDGPPALGIISPFTCFGSQVEGMGLSEMDKPLSDDSVKNISSGSEEEQDKETERTDDEQCRFMNTMNNDTFDLKSIPNYVGARSIQECSHFGTTRTHKENEKAILGGEVTNSTYDNGVFPLQSAVDSEDCSMGNAGDERPSIQDHGDTNAFLVNMSIAHDTIDDNQMKSCENNPQLCVTSIIEGNHYSSGCQDFVRSSVASEKELNPISNDNKVTAETQSPNSPQKNPELIIHSSESNGMEIHCTELSFSDKVNINFNTGLSSTTSVVDYSPCAAVPFDLNLPPIVDYIQLGTCHTEAIDFSAPTPSATNVLKEDTIKHSTQKLPENCPKPSEFQQEGQSVSIMQISTMDGSSCSQEDDIITQVQKIQHPQTNILETNKGTSKKPSFIKVFSKIIFEDSSMVVTNDSRKDENVHRQTSNVTTSMKHPNAMSANGMKLPNTMSGNVPIIPRKGNNDLIGNQQVESSKIIPSSKTRGDVASHSWTAPHNISNLHEQPIKVSNPEGSSRMSNGYYPSLSDWTRMLTSFQVLRSSGQLSKNEGGSRRNNMALLGSQPQSATNEGANDTSWEADNSGRQLIIMDADGGSTINNAMPLQEKMELTAFVTIDIRSRAIWAAMLVEG